MSNVQKVWDETVGQPRMYVSYVSIVLKNSFFAPLGNFANCRCISKSSLFVHRREV